MYFIELKAAIKAYLANEQQGSQLSRIKYATLALYSGIQDLVMEEENASRKTEGTGESQQGRSPEEQIHSYSGRDI